MFHVPPCHFELIFGLLTIRKCDFFEIEEALFQGHAWHFQTFFGLRTSLKCDFGGQLSQIYCDCKALHTHFLPLDQPKMRFR